MSRDSLVYGITEDVKWTMIFIDDPDSCFWQCACDLSRHHSALSACNICGRFQHTAIHWLLKINHAEHLTIKQAIELDQKESRELTANQHTNEY